MINSIKSILDFVFKNQDEYSLIELESLGLEPYYK